MRLTHLAEKPKIYNSVFLEGFLVLKTKRGETRCIAFQDLLPRVLTRQKSTLLERRLPVNHALDASRNS